MSSIHVKYLQGYIQFLRVVMKKFLGLFLITLTGCSSFLYSSGQMYQYRKCMDNAKTYNQRYACESIKDKPYDEYKEERLKL